VPTLRRRRRAVTRFTVTRLAMVAVGWLLWSGALVAQTAQSAQDAAYWIKAAQLSKFTLFVEWPKEAFTAADSPIAICVVGTDPFREGQLDHFVQGSTIKQRPVVVRRLDWSQDLRRCHILFVSEAETSKASELRSRLEGFPVLAVGESPGFARRLGIMNFYIDENSVRFEVNVEAAKRARLRIDARMLGLARIVTDGRPTR